MVKPQKVEFICPDCGHTISEEKFRYQSKEIKKGLKILKSLPENVRPFYKVHLDGFMDSRGKFSRVSCIVCYRDAGKPHAPTCPVGKLL